VTPDVLQRGCTVRFERQVLERFAWNQDGFRASIDGELEVLSSDELAGTVVREEFGALDQVLCTGTYELKATRIGRPASAIHGCGEPSAGE
jgi:hypothetical protein